MPENQAHNPDRAPAQLAEGWEGLARASADWPEDHEGLQLLKNNHVDRILGERGLGHLIVSKPDATGAAFLHKQNPQLNASADIEHTVAFLRQQGAKIPDKPGKRIEAYLDFISDPNYGNDGILTGDKESINRQIDAITIKAEDVPASYFELQKRIAREQGHGDIHISDYIRQKIIVSLQKEQKRSLGRWAEYLSSPANEVAFPDWFKKYAFEGVQKLGIFDKEKGEFTKRSKGTTAPFADLNPEALGHVLDALAKIHRGGGQLEDEKLTSLAMSGNFGKLYAHAISKVTVNPEQLSTTDGSWKKFNQIPYDDRNPESIHGTARELADSLQGHGTGWCTAGEETAQRQLNRGDFYIYYSKDAEGNESVPRVAIRMQDGEVVEVRGIGDNQNLEADMIDIAQDKFRSLPGGEKYEKKAADMRRLTEIERLMKSDPNAPLSVEDLRFLYEVDAKIDSFRQEELGNGYRDPRIDELLGKRDTFADLAKAYNVGIHEVATNDTFDRDTKIVVGDLDCKNIAQRFTHRSLASPAATRIRSKGFEDQDVDDYLVPEPIYAVTGKIVGFDQVSGLNIDSLEAIVAVGGRNKLSYEDLYKVASSFSKGAQLALFERGMQASNLGPLAEAIDKFDAINTLPLAAKLLAEEPGILTANLPRFRSLPIDFAHRLLDGMGGNRKRSDLKRVATLIPDGSTFQFDTQSLNEFLLEYALDPPELKPIIREFTGLDPGILPENISLHEDAKHIDIKFLLENFEHFSEGVDIDGIVGRLIDSRTDLTFDQLWTLQRWESYYNDNTRARLQERSMRYRRW